MISLSCIDIETTGSVSWAAQQTCARIAPVWPLDRSIAVNPYWELRGRSLAQVAKEMQRYAGSAMAMPLSFYKEQWQTGVITRADLQAAAYEAGGEFTVEHLLAALDAPEPPSGALPLLSDTLDLTRDPEHQVLWREHVTTQISQCCASFFDEGQADWKQSHSASLYRYWRDMITTDHGGSLLMDDAGWRRRATSLPGDARDLLDLAVEKFALSPDQVLPWFSTAIYRVSGWAAWCSFQAWQAKLDSIEQPEGLQELLAVRIAWELLLFDGDTSLGSDLSKWQVEWHRALNTPQSAMSRMVEQWQRAHELSYMRELSETLFETPSKQAVAPLFQAVFCIDVRSEVVRRHLEWIAPECQTIGFAGFFGVPMAYRAIGSEVAVPHLPGLFSSKYVASSTTGSEEGDARLHSALRSKTAQTSWRDWHTRQPASSFSLVETEGPFTLVSLLKGALRSGRAGGIARSGGQNIAQEIRLEAPLADKVQIARRFLDATGLSKHMATTVLIVGHGSETTNNPMSASLDCGACGGQNGLSNARVLCSLLNDLEVREGLKACKLSVPETTVFVAALHNTTVDTITLHPSPKETWDAGTASRIGVVLEQACECARQERAAKFGVACGAASSRDEAKRRAGDWAELRPEWSLADNASLIVGPREYTRGLDLKGRSFLHEYSAGDDHDGSMLSQILGGPMIVANWINLQYFASCVDALKFGSGNKTLHNVVGGHIGVFEGNGGDLRIGLARQSVHSGTKWCHNPIRLQVLIYADREQVEAALKTQPMAEDLVTGNWLYLYAAGPHGIQRVQPARLALTV